MAEPKYVCDVCGKKYSSKSKLVDCMLKHAKEDIGDDIVENKVVKEFEEELDEVEKIVKKEVDKVEETQLMNKLSLDLFPEEFGLLGMYEPIHVIVAGYINKEREFVVETISSMRR